jgi:hypothetical protein
MEETKYVSKNGKIRVVISQAEYADNPRNMTDEPLHCEDWSRDYSIMIKHERENESEDAGKLIRYLLARYGNNKKIIKLLKDNYKGREHDRYENGLSYDRSRKEWIVWSWQPSWKDYQGNVHESHWSEECSFCINIYDVDIYNIADYLSDEQIDTLCDEKYWTDGVKVMSYGFGYYGGISFYHEFSTDSEGIAWLEKDEFLKYSGCDEERWKNNTLREIEYLIGELEAWSNNEVYDVSVYHAVRVKSTREYPDGEHETEVREYTQWEQDDCCGGLYGEYDKMLPFMFEQFGLKQEDFEEEKD